MKWIYTRVPVLVAMLAGLSLSSCIIVAKGDLQPPSTGRELLDLKEARKSGLMTEAEYQQQRAKILEKSN